jgi:DNA-binding winged helix-turn-helix (wHTH) protein
VGELQIRPDMFDAYVGDRPASLSRKEYELLRQLANADGRVLEREEIYQRVWGYTMVRGDRSVDVFVRKLRQKLEQLSPAWRYVHTHFGVGYRFAVERVGEGPSALGPPVSGPAAPAASVSDPAERPIGAHPVEPEPAMAEHPDASERAVTESVADQPRQTPAGHPAYA